MFKKQIKLINPIIYFDDNQCDRFGHDNRAYRSLKQLFDAFWIYSKKELYLVGGVVRDLLLGRTPKDYDLTTNATVDEMREICAKVGLKTFDSGVKHGTLTIIDDFFQMSYECTTYRKDGDYLDGRHPENVEFVQSLEEDLKRRDLTINSFAYNLLTDELVALDESYFKDLEYGMIRTVGDANDRFNEDALRMLRALRFSAQLNFGIADDTYNAIVKNAALIAKVSKERIRDELTKILLSDNPQTLELFVTSGLEKYALSDKEPLKAILMCEHQNPWHYTDVFHHTMDVIKRAPKTFEGRWAALFHDFGKPAVKKLKEGTTSHYNYHGHPEISADMALELMEILKFSNEQKDLIYKFVKYHDKDLVECRNSTFKNILVDIGVDNFPTFIKLRMADAMAHCLIKDTCHAIRDIDKLYNRYRITLEKSQALTTADLAINGHDIIANSTLQGKAIGDCLRWMLDIVLETPEENTREKLLEYLKHFNEVV